MSWPGKYFAPPTPRARRWVERSLGPGSQVIRVRRLGGGTASAMHAVDVRRGGLVVRLALRRYVAFPVLEEEPDAPEREARNLQLVEKAGLAAPRLVAVDPAGSDCDVPAVLMTRLSGHLELEPRDMEIWLRRIAELLPPIHAVDVKGASLTQWQVWDDLRNASVPAWSRRPKSWRDLIGIARGPWPKYAPRFVHHDFQHYNVLWSRGRPTGVVDWMSAALGPVELDFAHFRHNLLLDFGYAVAERFARQYRDVTGEEPNPFWEALTLPADWAKTQKQREALDEYVGSLLAALR
jgi:aminoglycoside phosphotransferase (APT) family kinase protein